MFNLQVLVSSNFCTFCSPSSAPVLPKTVELGTIVEHGEETTRLPVRSALFKQRTGRLVVRWVTTSEYPLLHVFYCISVSLTPITLSCYPSSKKLYFSLTVLCFCFLGISVAAARVAVLAAALCCTWAYEASLYVSTVFVLYSQHDLHSTLL